MNVSSSKLIKFIVGLRREAGRLPEYSSRFSRKDFTLRQHVVLLCLKAKLRQRYREFCEILALMPEVCSLLGLAKIPHWTTLDKAFLRLRNHVLAAMLQAEPSGFASIDATCFDRRHASKQYLNHCKPEYSWRSLYYDEKARFKNRASVNGKVPPENTVRGHGIRRLQSAAHFAK